MMAGLTKLIKDIQTLDNEITVVSNGPINLNVLNLTEQEVLIIDQLYGLNGSAKLTQKELAQRLGLSPGWVSQMKLKTLRKLRHPVRVKRLNEQIRIAAHE